jgi:diguanylate cyclase (GGDEF)-like protein
MINLFQHLKILLLTWFRGEHSFERQWRIGKVGMIFQAFLTIAIIFFARLAHLKQTETRNLIAQSNTFALQTQSIHSAAQQVNYEQLLMLHEYQQKGAEVLKESSKERQQLNTAFNMLHIQVKALEDNANNVRNETADHDSNALISDDLILHLSRTLSIKLEKTTDANNEYLSLLEHISNNNIKEQLAVYRNAQASTKDLDSVALDLSKKSNVQAEVLSNVVEFRANILYINIILFSMLSLCWNGMLLYLLSRSMRSNLGLVRRITRLANSDPLTGLLNRRALNMAFKTLEAASGVSQSYRTPSRREGVGADLPKFSACLMLIDLDHFKRFNDTFGHVKGDEHLKTCASIWKNSVRSKDFVARIGGEEFAVLMPNCDELHAYITAERLQKSMPKDTSFSAGIALAIPGESFTSWHKRADKALYVAKNQGRAQAVLYSQVAKEMLLAATGNDDKKTGATSVKSDFSTTLLGLLGGKPKPSQ